MQSNTFILEFRNGTHFPITSSQATVVDQAWAGRAPVKIGDSTINTVDLVGIWPADVWFDLHPEDRPARPVEANDVSAFGLLMSGKETEEPKELSETGKLWFEAMRRNIKQLKEKGVYGDYIVRDGVIVAAELDKRETRPCKNHSHPMNPTPSPTVKAHKERKVFSPHQYNKLKDHPGYKVIDDETLEFTRAD